jgi:hypothetical protein
MPYGCAGLVLTGHSDSAEEQGNEGADAADSDPLEPHGGRTRPRVPSTEALFSATTTPRRISQMHRRAGLRLGAHENGAWRLLAEYRAFPAR